MSKPTKPVKRGRGRPALGRDAAPLFLRLTDEERAAVDAAAERAGQTPAEWARTVILRRAALA